MVELLRRGFDALGLPLDAVTEERLLLYSARLLARNQVMNLTAITQPEEVAKLHFLDSAALLTFWEGKNRSLIDVGTGAGFPGLVLKIVEPSLQLTLLDSLGKRVEFLRELCGELGFEDVLCLHGRAEEVSLTPEHRDRYDGATSRAVAGLPMLCELCLPYVRPGGVFLAMKGAKGREELAQAGRAIAALGGGEAQVQAYTLPLGTEGRCLLTIPKARPTPSGYPRRWAKIQKVTI